MFIRSMLIGIVLLACQGQENPLPPQYQVSETNSRPQSSPLLLFKDTLVTINISGRKTDILFPESFKGKVLWVFHGWNFSRKDWCKKTNLCTEALKKGYIVVLPDLGKSIYASQFFSETWPELRKEPMLQYVTDTLIKEVSEKVPEPKNGVNWFIMGLSTGAHGTGLIVEKTDTLFSAAALLSGDYDQTKLPQDKIFQANYGPYPSFSTRWKNIDNVVNQAEKFRIPAWIGHGIQDPIIPSSQSQFLFTALEKTHPHIPHKLVLVKGNHDYTYWGDQTTAILTFFDSFTPYK